MLFINIQMQLYRNPKQCHIMLKSLDDAGRLCWATQITNPLYKCEVCFTWISQDIGNIN